MFTKGKKKPGFDFNLKIKWSAEKEDEEEPEPVRGDTEDGTASMALVIAQTERDTYKRMYESLLARMTMEREETA